MKIAESIRFFVMCINVANEELDWVFCRRAFAANLKNLGKDLVVSRETRDVIVRGALDGTRRAAQSWQGQIGCR